LKECKFLKALTAAETACTLDPEMQQAQFRKGLALAALERWDEAVPTLIEAQRLAPSSTNKELADMIAMSKWQCKKAHLEADTEVPEMCKDARKPDEPKKEEEVTETKELSREQMLNKLHEKQASLAPRTKKHNRKVMQKLAGELTAEKQLLTKEMIAKTKEALAADEAVRTKASELATDQTLEKQKAGMKEGDAVDYQWDRVARFAATELASLCEAGDRASYNEPVAVVLPGVHKKDWGDEGQGLSLWNAFTTKDQHAHMCKFVAKFVDDSGAHAAMVVTPKAKLVYPNLLERNTLLPACQGAGYFVHLQAKQRNDSAAWFVEVSEAGAAGTAHRLEDVDAWTLIPNIFDAPAIQGNKTQSSKKNAKKNAKNKNRKAMSQVNEA